MTTVATTPAANTKSKPVLRRRQADRTAATRAALADAAADVLIERGWAATTVAEVCKRAGVTTGAFHHHYPSLPNLLADALRRLYATMGTKKTSPITDLVGLIDATWAAIGNPRFKAVLEAWLAMANNPTLRAEIGPVVAEFSTVVRPDSVAPSVLTDDDQRSFYITARETMLGLALGRATNQGKALGHERQVLTRLRTEATALDSSRGGKPRSSRLA
jgi:AcrR family transcriptional regulator